MNSINAPQTSKMNYICYSMQVFKYGKFLLLKVSAIYMGLRFQVLTCLLHIHLRTT